MKNSLLLSFSLSFSKNHFVSECLVLEWRHFEIFFITLPQPQDTQKKKN